MPILSESAINAACNAVTTLLTGGSIVFQTSGDVEVATCPFDATAAFADATGGIAVAATIAADATATGGTVDHAKLYASDGSSEIMEATCTEVLGGGDFEFTSLVIGAGDTVNVTSLTAQQPSGAV